MEVNQPQCIIIIVRHLRKIKLSIKNVYQLTCKNVLYLKEAN